MLFIRNSLFLLLLTLSMLVYCPVPLLGSLFLSEQKIIKLLCAWGSFILLLAKHLLGITYQVHGKDNIPQSPCVILSKHQSALDIFVLLTLFYPQTAVLKKEILRIPLFGWILATIKPIAIDRKLGRKALTMMIEQGVTKLKKSLFVVIYPEGTRVSPGEKGTYKSGGAMLAKKAGVPVVPVALNTGLFWQKGQGAVNKGTVDIVIGEAIDTTNNDIKTIMKKTEQFIEQRSRDITLNHPHYLAMKAQKNSRE